jgi:hypothetical protein
MISQKTKKEKTQHVPPTEHHHLQNNPIPPLIVYFHDDICLFIKCNLLYKLKMTYKLKFNAFSNLIFLIYIQHYFLNSPPNSKIIIMFICKYD